MGKKRQPSTLFACSFYVVLEHKLDQFLELPLHVKNKFYVKMTKPKFRKKRKCYKARTALFELFQDICYLKKLNERKLTLETAEKIIADTRVKMKKIVSLHTENYCRKNHCYTKSLSIDEVANFYKGLTYCCWRYTDDKDIDRKYNLLKFQLLLYVRFYSNEHGYFECRNLPYYKSFACICKKPLNCFVVGDLWANIYLERW